MELTGRQRRAAQLRWLQRREYPHELDADGRPLVLRSYVERRLGGRLPAPAEVDTRGL